MLAFFLSFKKNKTIELFSLKPIQVAFLCEIIYDFFQRDDVCLFFLLSTLMALRLIVGLKSNDFFSRLLKQTKFAGMRVAITE